MCICDLTEIFKTWLTPLIAVIAVYIAWQQWQTNENKFRLDRYDRRFKIYEDVRKIIGIIVQKGQATDEELLQFYQQTLEADFLFGPEIRLYINEIYNRGTQLQYWKKIYCDFTQKPPPDYDHKKVCDGMRHEFDWIKDQIVPVKAKFKKYLDLNDYGFFSRIKHSVLRLLRR
ncbi:MAG: hypothetical protein HZA15_13515 [Nitrospirae bacterium]|nr:hypothetical protein [Nitrospirota bacterium]